MLSEAHTFLFIHIPKTGGNSIQSVLKRYSEDQVIRRSHQDGLERFGVVNPKIGATKHAPLSYYKQRLPLDLYTRLYKFTCIRNPWERMISLYFSPDKNRTEWNRDAFIRVVKRAPPTLSYLDDRPRGIARLIQRKANIELDFVMKFETLQTDFDAVCDAIGIPKQTLPRYNAANRKHYSAYYDGDLIQLVAKKFQYDIEHYQYAFESVS